MSGPEVYVVKTYNGNRQKWAIGRFQGENGTPGAYRIGVFVKNGISFHERPFTSREDGEGFLVYHLDDTVRI